MPMPLFLCGLLFGPATGIYADLKALNKLMIHETFPQDNGVKVYDTYDPIARDIYWKYMNKKYVQHRNGWLVAGCNRTGT